MIPAGPQPQRTSEDIPDRTQETMSEDMPDTYARYICQKECQIQCQIKCHKRCWKECQNRCQIDYQKECQTECQRKCQKRCQKECQIGCQKERQKNARIKCQKIYAIIKYFQMRCQKLWQNNVTVGIARSKALEVKCFFWMVNSIYYLRKKVLQLKHTAKKLGPDTLTTPLYPRAWFFNFSSLYRV